MQKRESRPTARQTQWALRALFFTIGMLYATWGVQLPYVKSHYGLSAGTLSIVLLVVAIGSIAALTRLGPLLARISSRRACTLGGLLLAACTAVLLTAPNYGFLCVALLGFGALNATVDVAINAEASALEARMARPIMSSLHGMFSAGGIAGAALGAVLLSHGITPEANMIIASVLAAIVILSCRSSLTPVPAANDTAMADRPKTSQATHQGAGRERARQVRRLWTMGAVALIAMVAEGAMYDWTSVYMRDVLLTGPALASAAYATFSLGMAAGRFAGDYTRTRTGDAALLLVSGMVAAAGMVGALWLAVPWAALLGFLLMGLGLANMVPVLFAAAGQVDGFHPSEGISRVAGAAYAGMMVGPVLIGGIAELSSLSSGLVVVAAACVLVGVMGSRVLRRPLGTAEKERQA